MNSRLITFSGIDGAGKSTQIEMLIAHLAARGVRTKYLWTRGGNTNGTDLLKALLRRLAGKQLPPSGNSSQKERLFSRPVIQKLWLFLGILDLIRIYGLWLRWQIMNGRTVICDRYLDDTLVDFKVLFPGQNVEKWWSWRFLTVITPSPYRKFFLLISEQLSTERCMEKYEPFPDSAERKAIRFSVYAELIKNSSYEVLDGTDSPDAVARQIIASLSSS